MLYGDNFREINYRAYTVKCGKTTRVYLEQQFVKKAALNIKEKG